TAERVLTEVEVEHRLLRRGSRPPIAIGHGELVQIGEQGVGVAHVLSLIVGRWSLVEGILATNDQRPTANVRRPTTNDFALVRRFPSSRRGCRSSTRRSARPRAR